MKIIAVVVTYNRLPLLQQCIRSIQGQTRLPDDMVVINNSSTDGTLEWLCTQPVKCITQENKGGAAGFSTGIKEAYKQGADWIWLMDDDTIPRPEALQKLAEAVAFYENSQPAPGFFASLVLWTDGTPHLMNKTPLFRKRENTLSLPHQPSYYPVESGTFVSLLISKKAVKAVGLPIKEFFIWNDDIEYTTRITRAGFSGIFVQDSICIHHTPANLNSDIYSDAVSNLWKYKYGLRNELYTRKKNKGEGSFWRNIGKRLVVWPFYILARRKGSKWPFIKTVWQSTLEAITFNPPVERVSSSPLPDKKV